MGNIFKANLILILKRKMTQNFDDKNENNFVFFQIYIRNILDMEKKYEQNNVEEEHCQAVSVHLSEKKTNYKTFQKERNFCE